MKLSISQISNWLDCEEALFIWFHMQKLSKAQFIKRNRELLEQYINSEIGKGG